MRTAPAVSTPAGAAIGIGSWTLPYDFKLASSLLAWPESLELGYCFTTCSKVWRESPLPHLLVCHAQMVMDVGIVVNLISCLQPQLLSC